MSACKVRSLALLGVDALPVEVEVDVGAGLPGFSIVGLPDAAVQEARERVRVAISNSGYRFPTKKIIVNLAPASLRKEGPAFDLPIALAVLAASGHVPGDGLDGAGVVGELSLDGAVRPIRGALSMAEGAKKEGLGVLILPRQNAAEAAATSGPKTYGVTSLREAVSSPARPRWCLSPLPLTATLRTAKKRSGKISRTWRGRPTPSAPSRLRRRAATIFS